MRCFSLIALAFLACLNPVSAQDSSRSLSPEQKSLIPYSKYHGKLTALSLSLPDSLGGRALLGYINIDASVTRNGTLHGYRVRRIEISPDTVHWFTYSRNSPSQPGDSLLTAFRPWLDAFYRGMGATGTEKDSLFFLSDTLWYNYIIDFGSVSESEMRRRHVRPIYR